MSTPRPAAVIVLAAGEGTRMKSSTPKVLHPIGGVALLGHAIRAARATGAEHVGVVVRHERERVVELCAALDADLVIADQDDVKGTGRAVECGLAALPADLSGTILVTYGDVPLLTGETLIELTLAHTESGSAVSVVTAHLADPTGYGRVVRDAEGRVEKIVEQKDATADERAITEINSGIYAFEADVLRDALARVGTDNAQGEKYLTDVRRHRPRRAATRCAPTSSTTCGRPRASTTASSWPTSGASSTAGSASSTCGPASRSSTPRRRGSTSTSPSAATPRCSRAPSCSGPRASAPRPSSGPR